MFLVSDTFERLFNLFLRKHRMMFRQFLRYIIFVVSFEKVDTFVIFYHFHVHIRNTKAKNVIFVLWISDFRYGIVQYIEAHLMVKVIVSGFVQLMQV
jgi:hypothetical protein